MGNGGVIRHTTNGGTTWTAQTSNTTQNLRGVFFVNSQEGWAVGNNGTIDRTLNGGTTWVVQTSGTTSTLRGVCFSGVDSGWVVGTGGLIRHTANGSTAGGSTWAPQTSTTNSSLYAVDFTDANNGWVTGSGGTVRHTVNGGTTWTTPTTTGITGTIYGVHFIDANNGWVVAATGKISHTTNGGTMWTAQTSGVTVTLYGVDAIDANNGWAIGTSGTIRNSTNGGTTWAKQTSPTTQALRSIVNAGGSLWACGNGGVVATYLIDTTPPVTTATGLQAANNTGWRTTGQSVTLTATDAQSGVKATYYTVDGGATTTYTKPFTVSTSGTHTVKYWSVDVAGNTEAQHTGYVNIDTTAPVTAATGLQANNHSGWATTSQSVTLTPTDAQSGVTATYYTIDAGSQLLYTGPFLVGGNGSHTVTYYSVDAAGNVEATNTGYVNIDTAPPVTTATGLQASGSSGWQNTSQLVTLTPSDPLSGVAHTYYTVNGGGAQTYTVPFTVSATGTNTIVYWSVDAMNNTEAHNTGYVNIDLLAPTVASDADSAWHTTAVTVHLTANDTGGSGLAGTQYRLLGSGTWLTATGNAFTVPAPTDGSNDGVHTYQFQALDNAGNVSATGSCTVWIDATPPTTAADGLAPDQFSQWRTTSQTVSLTPSDGTGSGVAATYYTLDGGGTQTYTGSFTVSGFGQHPVTYWSTDAAGNVEAVHTGWVNISNPYAQATGLAADNHSDWRNTPVTVTITGGGDHAPITIFYKLDTGAWQSVASPASIPVSGAASHTLLFYAQNDLSVQSATQTGYVNIDTAAPVTTATGLQANNHSGWITTSQSVTFNPTDDLSGVAATYYTVDSGAQQLYAGGPILVGGNGSHTVTYHSVDAAGNVEATNTGYVNIDTAAPVTTASGLQTGPDTGWQNTSQLVTLTPSDGTGSGVAHTYYTVNGGATTTYTTPFTIPVTATGTNTVVYWSVDAMNNTEVHNTGYVNIDTLAPVTTASGLQTGPDTGWQNTAQLVTLTPSDGTGSGVAHTYYTLNGGATTTYTTPFTIPVTATGTNTVVYWSVDAAGNIENNNTGYVNIDTLAPVTTASGLQTGPDTGWQNTAQLVTLTPSDGTGSGVAHTYYTLNGGATTTYTTPFTIPVTATGTNTVVYWSVDAAGNIENNNTGYVNIDTLAPVTTASGLQTGPDIGWQNTSQLVTLTPSDGTGCGIAATYYTVNNGATTPYTTPFTIPVTATGTNTVVYWSVDRAGNIETHNTGYVNIDTAPPTVTSNADSLWHNVAVTVTLTPADTGGSGVASTQYRLQGSGTWLTATGNAFTVPAPSDGSNDGAHVYQFQALDNAGNVSSTGSGTVKIDTQGPVVTPTGLQVDDITGWQTTSQTVTLTSNDAGSGVAATYYTVNGGSTLTYSGTPFTVSASGSNKIVYWATDALGNVTAQHTGYVNISNPYAQATGLAADNHSGWRNTSATVTITGGGDNSPFTIYYKVDSGSLLNTASPATVNVSGVGNHTVLFYAKNSVGTLSTQETGYVNIETTPPVTTATNLQTSNNTGWATTSQTVTLSATDAQSGVAATYYTIDGGSQQTYTAPFTVSAPGSHTVVYWSVDAAGNVETHHTGYVNIDASTPVTTATGLSADDSSGWTTNTAPTVTLSATDPNGPGVATTYYTVDGSDPQVYAGAFTVTDDGQHPVTYWSVDSLGNTEAANTGYVNIDTTPPTTTTTSLMADGVSGWQDYAQTVTLAADDGPGCGVAHTYYTVNGGLTQTYTSPFTVSTQGSNLITYWSVDALGNTETANSGYANIDLALPTVSSDSDGLWHNSAVTVHLTPADTGGSGVAGTQYRLQGSGTWLTAAGNAFVVPAPSNGSGDGVNVYEIQSLDNAGNASAPTTCTVKIDTSAPVSGASGLQATSYSGWQNTAQPVILTASDLLSGVAHTYYTVNGGGQQTYSGAFTIPVTATGTNTIVYWSVDGAGNTEAQNTGYVNIDTALPTVASDADSAWHNSAVTVHLTPADTGGSGIAGTQYRLQGSGTWLAATGNAFTVPAPSNGSGDGANVYQFQAVDGAGNVSTMGSCTVKIDTQAPQTTAAGLQPDNQSGWRATSQAVTLTPSDGTGSGIAHTYYSVDGGAQQTYSGTPFTVSGMGRHRVTYWSTDNVGNSEGPHTGYVNIDTAPPVTAATGLSPNSNSSWEDTPQVITLDASDSLSGVAHTYYTVNSGGQQTYSGPFTISDDGAHTVTYWSVDAVGNIEATNTGYVNVDLTPPVTAATGLVANATTWTTTSPQTVSLVPSDGGSGMSGGAAATYYRINSSGAYATYSAALTFTADGSYKVDYYSVDSAGNSEAVKTGYVNIDTTPPVTVDNAGATWHAVPFTLTLTATDVASTSTQYSVGDQSHWQTGTSLAFTTVWKRGGGSGLVTVYYRSTDAAGLIEPTKSCTVMIDTSRPTTTDDAPTGPQASDVTVHLTGHDTYSGIGATWYQVDGGTWVMGNTVVVPAPANHSNDGLHTIRYYSIDNAGNVEASYKVCSVLIATS